MGKGKAVALPTWENDCQACTQHTNLVNFTKKIIYPLVCGDGLIQNDLDTFSEVTERRNNINESGKEFKKQTKANPV